MSFTTFLHFDRLILFRHFALLNYNNTITLKIRDTFPDLDSSKTSSSFPEVEVCPTKAFSPFPRYTSFRFPLTILQISEMSLVSSIRDTRLVSRNCFLPDRFKRETGWELFSLKRGKVKSALHRASSLLRDNFHLEGFNRSFILICMRTSRCQCLYVNRASSYRHRGADPTL